VEWETTTAYLHDKNVAYPLIDSIRDYCYVMIDAAYDSSDIMNTYLKIQNVLLLLTPIEEGG